MLWLLFHSQYQEITVQAVSVYDLKMQTFATFQAWKKIMKKNSDVF